MVVKILGSAAGGGFPQWNCACSNCARLREDRFQGEARSQAQLAWSDGAGGWTLLNASPDLRQQIESTPELWPRNGRKSPIRDVILTGAEVDQALGLLLLREFHSFRVHATPAVRAVLTEDNSMYRTLARFAGQVCWSDIASDTPFSAGGARIEPLELPGSALPGFVQPERAAQLKAAESAIGLIMTPEAGSEAGGGAMAFLPGIGSVSDELIERLAACNVILFDGTFWTDEEPKTIPGITRTARQMGHLPISGPGGSLDRLSSLSQTRRIFIHINNTNPILDEAGNAFRTIRDCGWELARDGMEILL
ncbi:MAG TPA: pyrroloquinoline quinone biosynthesis protein PqqB [Bryobacteraceae bacterium]